MKTFGQFINENYFKGVSKSTADKKKAQMKKQADMDDDDPNAYKEMPGDTKGKKTSKTSKHTKKYHELYNESVNEQKIKLKVWTDRKSKKKTIDLDASQLKKAVSSGHDTDWSWSIDNIKYQLDNGDKKGTTKIDRYGGGGSDTVYWELNESVNEADDDDKQSTKRGPIDGAKIEKALKTKSEETGVPIGIIRAVMRRGMAAWKTGHRPGATQEQWGYARVNAFLTKGEGTWGKADKDLAKEVRDGGHDKKLKK